LASLKLIEPHKNQRKIIKGKRRFNHIKCGRRFGKTFFINQLLGKAFANKDKKGKSIIPMKIGIWFPTYKDLDHVWTKAKSDFHSGIAEKSESLHQIKTITGGHIHFWSMENPDSGRGYDYDRAIMDEFAKAKKNKEAWQATIRPTLTDRKGDAWMFSTPKGKRNYFYQLQLDHIEDHDWAFFKFTSYDNPYLDPVEIDSAKKQLDKVTFQQEYLAEDVDANEMPFLYCFDEQKHIGNSFVLADDLPLWLSFDFNVLPMTCVLGQRHNDNTLRVNKIIKLNNASIYDMCDHIKVKYPGYRWIATGDASGKNRSGTTKGNLSYWQIIRKELNLSDYQIKLRSKNLDHTSSQVICNSVLEHKDIVIHKDCKDLVDDCIYAAVDEYGKLIKTPERGLHFLDGFRYLLDANFPNVLKIK
jgi:hypothetical protein